jgi:prefoldin alpha subunit
MMENNENSDRTMKMFELQMMQGQMDQLKQQKQAVMAKKAEIEATRNALKGIDKNDNSEIMVPLGSGVFVKAKVADKSKIHYSVGAGVVVTKNAEDTIKYLEQQEKVTNEADIEIDTQMKEMADKAQQLIGALEKEEKEMQSTKKE